MAREFNWTPGQVDEIELDLFFDLIIFAETNNETSAVIDEWTEDSGPLGKFSTLTRSSLSGFRVIN
jgi:hypothetical protein